MTTLTAAPRWSGDVQWDFLVAAGAVVRLTGLVAAASFSVDDAECLAATVEDLAVLDVDGERMAGVPYATTRNGLASTPPLGSKPWFAPTSRDDRHLGASGRDPGDR